MLRRKLDKLGVERVEHNIWDDADAAATVRRHARGNETVPTVVVGDIGLVNPSAGQVLALLEAEAPHLSPADVETEPAGRMGRMMNRVLGG